VCITVNYGHKNSNICWFLCYNQNANDIYQEYAHVTMKMINKYISKIKKYLIIDPSSSLSQLFKTNKKSSELLNKTTMMKNNFKIIEHTFSLSKKDSFLKKDKNFQKIGRGAFLRVDIPYIIDKYQLDCRKNYIYTDSDVLVLNKDIEQKLMQLKTEKFMASSESTRTNIKEHNHFNTGVLFANTTYMQKTYKDFLKFIETHDYNFDALDQGAFITFYGYDNHDFLDNSFNWKPYWGINQNANIVHFHGPKPREYYDYINGKLPDVFYVFLNKKTESFYQYYVSIYEKYNNNNI